MIINTFISSYYRFMLYSAILLLLFSCGCKSISSNNVKGIINEKNPSIVAIGVVENNATGSNMVRILGSGVIIDPSGIVVTCSHVVEDYVKKYTNFPINLYSESPLTIPYEQKEPLVVFLRIYVGGSDNSTGTGFFTKQVFTISGKKNSDIAILKLDGKGKLPYMELGNSDEVKAGQRILLAGYPLGEALFEKGHSVRISWSEGIISSVLPHETLKGDDREYFQLDITANHGNSGGPLISIDNGKVVGLLQGGVEIKGMPLGINYAIPINKAKPLIQEIKRLSYQDIKSGNVEFEKQ